MHWDFDRQIERRGTDSFKWGANERLFGRRDLLPFWVADMDFATPEPILQAIRDRCDHPLFGYGIRSEEYFQSIQDWLRERELDAAPWHGGAPTAITLDGSAGASRVISSTIATVPVGAPPCHGAASSSRTWSASRMP